MADDRNPYAPPTAHVADPVEQPRPDGPEIFIANGRGVSVGRGAGWIGDAWRLFRERPGKWLLILLGLLLIYVAVSWVPYASLASSLLWPFVGAGVAVAADFQRRSGNFEQGMILAGLRKPAALLVIGAMFLLTSIALYASLAIMVGTDVASSVVLGTDAQVDAEQFEPRGFALAMLLYMVLALPITAATYFAPPLIMLHDVSAGRAMKMSLIGSIKNIVPGIVFGVCATVFVLVSIIPLGLGLFISIPVLMLTSYTMYRDIFIESR
jgi:uncharacterized membrane protein